DDLVHAHVQVAEGFEDGFAAVDGDEAILGCRCRAHLPSVQPGSGTVHPHPCSGPRGGSQGGGRCARITGMSERLTALDASFLYVEDRTTPMHLGGVAVFEAPGLDYETVLELIDRRLHAVPRYRQRVVHVPGRLARPVWVDDEDFDLTYHVRRSALPRPGDDEQLHE